jgi:hypothetical protein
MSALLLIDTKRKLEAGQDIFRAKTIKALMSELAVLTARVEAAEAEAGKLREALGTVDKIVFSIGEYSADGLRKAIMKVVLDNARRVKLQESEK